LESSGSDISSKFDNWFKTYRIVEEKCNEFKKTSTNEQRNTFSMKKSVE
jgi:hypothetical protein